MTSIFGTPSQDSTAVRPSTTALSSSKKRRAEDSAAPVDDDNSNSDDAPMMEASTAAIAVESLAVEDVSPSQPPSAKKPKLSKKELLLAAKLRLKEAQDKKKALQDRLDEEQKQEEATPPEGTGDLEEEEEEEYDEEDYHDEEYADDYYYYEYHIPPVTGAMESLLVTNIPSIGPREKVRFVTDPRVSSCVENCLQVIQDRRNNSNANTNSAATVMAPVSISPVPPPPPPPPLPLVAVPVTTKSLTNSRENALTASRGLESSRPSRNGNINSSCTDREKSNTNTNTNTATQPQSMDIIDAKMPQSRNGDASQQSQQSSRRDANTKPLSKQPLAVAGAATSKEPPPTRQQQQQRTNPTSSSNTNAMAAAAEAVIHNKNNAGGNKSAAAVVKKAFTMKDATAAAAAASRPLKKKESKKAILAANKNKIATTTWKRGLAQITGKSLDCKLDLPSDTSFIIRTTDNDDNGKGNGKGNTNDNSNATTSVVAKFHFLAAPNNTKLLEHQPSKKQLQAHLSSVQRLPCHASSAWKGQDIIDFMKRQVENQQQTSKGKSGGGGKATTTTYQPPARRNLPMTHWAIVELESPLQRPNDSLGYFTGTHESKGNTTTSKDGSNNLKSSDIGFAGKFIWNLTDTADMAITATSTSTTDKNSAAPRMSSKLSKWGEVVVAVPTTGIRNSACIATVQGFYELPTRKAWEKKKYANLPITMPQKLKARKVILPKSRTIGIIIGPAPTPELDPSVAAAAAVTAVGGDNNNSNNPQQFGCVQVLFPNGLDKGSSIRSLKGSRAILYD